MRRLCSFIYLVTAAVLTVASLADYVDVHDIGSSHWGGGVWDSIALSLAGGGLVLLLLGLALRLFLARWVVIGALLVCSELIIQSLITYPKEAADLAYSFVPARSREELYGLLFVCASLLLITIFEKGIRTLLSGRAGAAKQG